MALDPALEATLHPKPRPAGHEAPWKASYFWIRNQRDRAVEETRRLRRILDPGYVEGDLVDGGSW